MFTIASKPDTVLNNVTRFGGEVRKSPALQGRLAYARAWYAHKSSRGEWLFGPSKFVGYEGLNAKTYIESAESRDGRRTEAQLQDWFTVVDRSSPIYDELNTALVAFLASFGKVPSTLMRINVLKDLCNEASNEKQTDPHELVVDLMVAVAKTLPPSYRSRLRSRISI